MTKKMENFNNVQKKQPLVSICIPSYNRGELLINSLNSLTCQKEFQDGDVEIVISDNCSEDNTEELCREYIKRYPSIIYHRENVNSGFGGNQNFITVMALAHGKLLKLINDDFLFNPDALSYFCRVEQKYEADKPQVYLSNAEGCKYREKLYEKEVDIEGFLYAASFWVTWIGTFTIWKEDLDKYINDQAGITHQFWHIEETMDVLAEKKRGVVDDTVFGHRQPLPYKDISYNIFHNFYENMFGVMKPFHEQGLFSDKCYEWLEKDMMVNFMPQWMANQELRVGNIKYNDSISLKEEVLNFCKDKPYYGMVLNNYKKARMRLKLGMFIRNTSLFKLYKKMRNNSVGDGGTK